ncbi:MAG: DUF952 domain-containing protein [Anaerolineae bacterium]|nr:DUF952 domain-containing protein [Anaerolineae bacterium]
MIFHITTREQWQQAETSGRYTAESLESEGFIHCSTLDQVVPVANQYYRGQAGMVLLCIAPDRLTSTLRYETPSGPPIETDSPLFPHIYGPINREAITAVVDFPPQPDGTFLPPPELD